MDNTTKPAPRILGIAEEIAHAIEHQKNDILNQYSALNESHTLHTWDFIRETYRAKLAPLSEWEALDIQYEQDFEICWLAELVSYLLEHDSARRKEKLDGMIFDWSKSYGHSDAIGHNHEETALWQWLSDQRDAMGLPNE